jgi:branched-chain amino acid transport system substrate-binding protein
MKHILCIAISFAFALVMSLSPLNAQTAELPIKIGVLTEMSGAYADVGGAGSVVAAQMAVADFGGSVLGMPISVVSGDHQSKSDVAMAIARRWFDVEGVDVIVDLSNSAAALAVQGLGKELKRISIVSTAATDILTNQQCSPYGAHWTYDSYSVAKTLAAAMGTPDSTWFFLTADYAGGRALQTALAPFLEAKGVKILGGVRHPLNTSDMSSFLMQAQASGAKYIALANAGTDLINTMKQAREFGLSQAGQTLIGIVLFLSDLKAMGLEEANGLMFGTGFVADSSPEAAAWSKRFFELRKVMPNDTHAGVYSAVLHYLKAVQAAGTREASAVMAKMRELPVNDMFAKNGVLRKDGRMMHDMYLVQAKTPAESKGPWDLVKIVKTIPGSEAFRPLSESECPLVKAAIRPTTLPP